MKGSLPDQFDTPDTISSTSVVPPEPRYLTSEETSAHAKTFAFFLVAAACLLSFLIATLPPCCVPSGSAAKKAAVQPGAHSTGGKPSAAAADTSAAAAKSESAEEPAARGAGAEEDSGTGSGGTAGNAGGSESGKDPKAEATAPCVPGAAIREARLIELVMAAGAVGGLVHAGTSFATFAGNRQLMSSWLPWFYLRPLLGMLLALLSYAAKRGGYFGDSEVVGCTGVYQMTFFAGMAGMFSKQVADKLSDLMENLITPSKPPSRKDGLKPNNGNPPPAAGRSAATTAESPSYSDQIQEVQRQLIRLKRLPSLKSDGSAGDDGLLDDRTRQAVGEFLRSQIDDEQRAIVFGEEHDPGYWTKVLDALKSVG